MRDELTGLLEKADLALGSAAGVIDEQALAPLIESVRAVRARLGYPEEVLVVALAGGTGSGKSSLFNALTGEELAEAGGVRPTTSQPAVAVPESMASRMGGYLDRLGITERHSFQGPRLCLLDLPDTDSVEESHRHRVDAVLPLVDVVVWVTDPEKYRDARFHHDYLRPLAMYGEQFVFVLNQIDRLDEPQVEAVRSDLLAALREDGFGEPVVVALAADPVAGPPLGLEDLIDRLEEKRARGVVLHDKLLTDVAEATRALEKGLRSGLGFDDRAAAALDTAVRALAGGDDTTATRELVALLADLEMETDGETAEKLGRLAAEVPHHISRIRNEAGDAPKSRSVWPWRRRRGEVIDPDRARASLSQAVIRPARAVLAKRAVAIAAVAELGVEVEKLRQNLAR